MQWAENKGERMPTSWNRKAKCATAAAAINLLAARFKIDIYPEKADKLATKMERAAWRFHLTHGLKRDVPGQANVTRPARVSLSTVSKRVNQLRVHLSRARDAAWVLQHIAPPVLTIDGKEAAYGTVSQATGASYAAAFFNRPELIALHSGGIIEALETMIWACDQHIAGEGQVRAEEPKPTERHVFCWEMEDIYRAVTKRKPAPSDGERLSGSDPFTDFFCTGWRISEAGKAIGAHAIDGLLKSRAGFR
jgi:hypothetical protein